MDPKWERLNREPKVREGLEVGLRYPGRRRRWESQEQITVDGGLVQHDCDYLPISSLWNRYEF